MRASTLQTFYQAEVLEEQRWLQVLLALLAVPRLAAALAVEEKERSLPPINGTLSTTTMMMKLNSNRLLYLKFDSSGTHFHNPDCILMSHIYFLFTNLTSQIS